MLRRLVRRLRELAERTPASRERYVDLLRAVAITAVVLGHWLITDIGYDGDRRLTGHSALKELTWAHPVTWLVQVLPLFFIVGGFSNAASLDSRRRRGGDSVGWLQDRSGRLIRPTTMLIVVLAGGTVLARLLGAKTDEARMVVWFASIPLWFLSAYLLVVLLTPIMYGLHRRFGFAVPLVLVGLVALGDLARLLGPSGLGDGNFLFGWLAIHQMGFAWRDGRLPFRRRVAVPLLLGGLAAALLLTVVGPYPISMIDVPGERLHNMSPPTLALLSVATAQLGLVMLLRDPAERWLQRIRPWTAVVAVNSVILTIFLWHISAAILVIGVLHALHLLPTPPVGTAAWWLWRVPWLIMLTVALAVLVAIFGRSEVRGSRRPAARPSGMPGWLAGALSWRPLSAVLTVGGFVAVIFGLIGNNLAVKEAHEPVGVPTVALVAFLAGAAVLRLLRSLPE
jgi:Acyltransferase family